MPELTVVIPTRNRVRYLPASVDSVLAQEDVDLELVVIDDGSTDATEAYLRGLASRDQRVRVIRNARGRGASAARNQGAALARTPLLAFNDDDCVWDPRKIRLQRTRMRASGAGVVYCREAILWADLGLLVNGRPDAERRGAVASLVTANDIGTVGPLIDRRLFEQVGGFDESLPRLQEWDLWLRLGLVTSFAYVPEILVRGEAVTDGISHSSEALERAAVRLLDKWTAADRLSPRHLALLHYGVGKYLLADGHTHAARRAFLDGFRLDRGSPLVWLGLFGSALTPWQFNVLRRARIRLRRLLA